MTLRERLQQTDFEGPAQEAMLGLLVAAAHLERRLQEACERHGITHDQYNVLRILRGAPAEGHPRYEIARRMINRAPDVTRLLDRLEAKALVSRTRSEEDRRVACNRITTAGMRLLQQLDPEVAAVHDAFAAGLSRLECRRLAHLCDRLLD